MLQQQHLRPGGGSPSPSGPPQYSVLDSPSAFLLFKVWEMQIRLVHIILINMFDKIKVVINTKPFKKVHLNMISVTLSLSRWLLWQESRPQTTAVPSLNYQVSSPRPDNASPMSSWISLSTTRAHWCGGGEWPWSSVVSLATPYFQCCCITNLLLLPPI